MSKILWRLFIVLVCIPNASDGQSLLRPASFPTVSSDESFVERMNNIAAGYKPFAGRSAYQPVMIEGETRELLQRAEAMRQSDRLNMTEEQYCEKYPLDEEMCAQTSETNENIIKIGDRDGTYMQNKFVGRSFDGRDVFADSHVHNGPCTMPQRSNVFSNKILTSGRYQTSDPAFEKMMITTFRAEGGCGNHPNDSGGYTCYGISQNNNPEIDVRNITRADAEDIAHRKYYKKYNFHELPDHIRGDVFAFGWGAGPVTAVRNLCRVLGLPERNVVDSEIVQAVENYQGDLHNDYLDAHQQYLIKCAERPGQKVFLKGWMNRVKLIRENGCHYPTTNPIYR